MADLELVYMLPEGLVPLANRMLDELNPSSVSHLAIGCQGIHWQDVSKGGNFGAFTSCLPATAAWNLGARWALVGHSEERRAKLQVMEFLDPSASQGGPRGREALAAVDRIMNEETMRALNAGLNVLLCVGETSEQRGDGSEEEMLGRLGNVLADQVSTALQGAVGKADAKRIVIGYEPIWAIGPGRTPPGGTTSARRRRSSRVPQPRSLRL